MTWTPALPPSCQDPVLPTLCQGLLQSPGFQTLAPSLRLGCPLKEDQLVAPSRTFHLDILPGPHCRAGMFSSFPSGFFVMPCKSLLPEVFLPWPAH